MTNRVHVIRRHLTKHEVSYTDGYTYTVRRNVIDEGRITYTVQ